MVVGPAERAATSPPPFVSRARRRPAVRRQRVGGLPPPPPPVGARRGHFKAEPMLKFWAGYKLSEYLFVASALSDAATRKRKLRGCGQMRTLLKALDGRRPESDNGAVLKAA